MPKFSLIHRKKSSGLSNKQGGYTYLFLENSPTLHSDLRLSNFALLAHIFDFETLFNLENPRISIFLHIPMLIIFGKISL